MRTIIGGGGRGAPPKGTSAAEMFMLKFFGEFTPDEKIQKLRNLILEAAQVYNDEACGEYLGLFKKASEEKMAYEQKKFYEAREQKGENPYYAIDARYHADIRELYLQFPYFQDREDRVSGGFDPSDNIWPALTESKLWILNEEVERWKRHQLHERHAGISSEAMLAFGFTISAFQIPEDILEKNKESKKFRDVLLAYESQQKIVVESFRKATDYAWSPYQLAEWISLPDVPTEIVRSLGHGMVNFSVTKEIRFMAKQLLLGKTDSGLAEPPACPKCGKALSERSGAYYGHAPFSDCDGIVR